MEGEVVTEGNLKRRARMPVGRVATEEIGRGESGVENEDF